MPLGKPLLEALDRMGYGGIVLDTSGQIRLINEAAVRLLQENSPDHNSQCCPDWKEILRALLRLDVAARLTMGKDPWIVIRRDAAGRRPLILHVVPIAQEATSGPHTVAILVDLEAPPRPAADTLQKIFGLTPAEARLAIEIASGQSLDDFAAGHHVSVATPRKQLASVFAKTYTHRQAELVALLVRVSILP
jgi:DNA-binding CsgD family transcriptional regulator